MNGLLFLNSGDFSISKGTKGNIMCHLIPGFSLILFYSTQCEHCQSIIPIFKKLPGSVGGCQFGMINVSTNKACVKMSKNTISPITYVPYIVFYINGRPSMIYKGPHDGKEIQKFIMEVAENVQSKQNFYKNVKHSSQEPEIPSYCLGKPLCGRDDKVCYLSFDNAYNK
jgi:thiol-disulfide isomerase/thioredoxin